MTARPGPGARRLPFDGRLRFGDVAVTYVRAGPQEFAEHAHRELEVAVGFSRPAGEAVWEGETGGRLVQRTDAGHVSVLPSGQPHGGRLDRPAEVLLVYLEPQDGDRPLRGRIDRDPVVRRLVAPLRAVLAAGERPSALAVTEIAAVLRAGRRARGAAERGGRERAAPRGRTGRAARGHVRPGAVADAGRRARRLGVHDAAAARAARAHVDRAPRAHGRRLVLAERDDVHARGPVGLRRVGPRGGARLGVRRPAAVLPPARGLRRRPGPEPRPRRAAVRPAPRVPRRAPRGRRLSSPHARRSGTAGCRVSTGPTGRRADGQLPDERQGRSALGAREAYLLPALDRPELELWADTQALGLVFDGARCAGVTVRRDGVVQTVRAAREVVLAASAAESPKLLMLAGIGRPEHLAEHGIPVRVPLPGVGANLHDHVACVLRYAHARDLPEAEFAWEAGLFHTSSPGWVGPDLETIFTPTAFDRQQPGEPPGGVTMVVALLRPVSRGEVRLASADPLAAPVLDPSLLARPADAERLAVAVRRSLAIARTEPLAGWIAGLGMTGG